jgi:hypothetical protein
MASKTLQAGLRCTRGTPVPVIRVIRVIRVIGDVQKEENFKRKDVQRERSVSLRKYRGRLCVQRLEMGPVRVRVYACLCMSLCVVFVCVCVYICIYIMYVCERERERERERGRERERERERDRVCRYGISPAMDLTRGDGLVK